ncbi:AMP-fatty acid ligase [Photobacterium kishitanii]|uniref:AMP-fatty acid ligase n=1 Tax=Photobacterium kishitanii TaxID=318456 RepID=A0AAX0YPY2_9GAMM|nr:AMP-binding protein [Photobacterium kishitanii]KJG57389.1 AMP-fatty acid ligase [Photobacterium kishitanii]KJG60866.1 AMP-fatty acid ligase [Photobacterium kishitanii]KJG65140.1 AMP-fatty acid ligase [Photobacterium kishitanii]KJG69286.1 AMP-fatty acid ligase [Photobacterium kishitanii]PSU19971.1 AMP-fatty acid ligase [Photobacterium kishitanii]
MHTAISPSALTSLSTLMQRPTHHLNNVAINGTTQHSWPQFQAHVFSLSQQLALTKQQRFAICCKDSYIFAVAFMAVIHANKKLILPSNHQPAALAELSPHFDVLLHDTDTQIPASLVTINLSPLIHQHQALTSKAVFPTLILADIELTLFTSGSSGTPKAIIKTLDLLDNEIAQLEAIWGQQLQHNHICSTVSHQHIYGLLFRVLWPLCCGRSFDCFNLDYPEQVQAQASTSNILISSPALLKRLNNSVTSTPYNAIFSSGGPLPFAAAQHCQQFLGALPFEVFGSTETGGIGYRQQQQSTTPWLRFDVVKIAVNVEQCLKIRSPFVDPNQWYQTCDHCLLIDDHYFELKGRTDRIIKIEEKRISLTEIERRLCQLAWIDEAAVLPLERQQRLQIAAVITLTAQGTEQLERVGKGQFWLLLRQQLRQWIEPIAIPRRFRPIAAIPLNSQGKRLMRDLENLFNDHN